MSKRLIYFVLTALLVTDLVFSFMQYRSTPLDGDMAGGIIPAVAVEDVLNSPLGLDAALHGKFYSNPNRYVCHATFKAYFSHIPFLLQEFSTPVESIYLSCAIFKTSIQFMLLALLAMAVTGKRNIFRLDGILVMLLMTVLFQTNGYRIYMGIIDPSITYTFFYAMPCVLVLLYFLPLIIKHFHGKVTRIPGFIKILWLPLGLAVCLSGPLNPGIVLVVSFLIILHHITHYFRSSDSATVPGKLLDSFRKIPGDYWFYLLPISLFALYSLYLGKFNYINMVNEISTGELYSRLPSGIYYLLTQKPGMSILLLIITVNMIIIRKKYRNEQGDKILKAFGWIGIFALIYILLLPLGGYREYRSNVLRYDTIMPITLCLMFIFAASSLFLLKQFSLHQRYWYLPLITLILFIFTNADRGKFDQNLCEREAFKTIIQSKDPVVVLNDDCTVLSWGSINKPEDSALNAELLQFWKITQTEKLYYHK